MIFSTFSDSKELPNYFSRAHLKVQTKKQTPMLGAFPHIISFNLYRNFARYYDHHFVD